MEHLYDTIIIGGSYAGLSAALFLGNANRDVLIIDSAQPRNIDINYSHNLLGYEGESPAFILEKAQKEISNLSSVEKIKGTVISVQKQTNNTFCISLSKTEAFNGKLVILATGLKNCLPQIDGIKQFWPENIFHCPYCAGPSFKGKKLAVYGQTNNAYFLTLIFKKWTNQLTLISESANIISDKQKHHLEKLNINVIMSKINKFDGIVGESLNIHLENGQKLFLSGMFIDLPHYQAAQTLINQLGCQYTNDNLLAVDNTFQTSVSGIYAIGDMSQAVRKISTAISSGTIASFSIDQKLTELTMLA